MKLKSESGRSMVEMLGVLAIIGVLTIGGIAGYTFAMNKYRTNEVLDGASKRAITVATQLAIEANPDLTEYTNDNDVAGGTFTAEVEEYEEAGQFGLKIGGVKKPVCEGLIKSIGDKTPLRAIIEQDTEDPDTDMTPENCKEENALVLIFNNSVSAKDSEGSRASASGPTDEEIMTRIGELEDENALELQEQEKAQIASCAKQHYNDYKDAVSCCMCIADVGEYDCVTLGQVNVCQAP